MQVKRRYWEVGAIGGLLAVLAVVLDRPLLAGGAVGVGAWLLTHQFVFLGQASDLRSGLSVGQDVEREEAFTGETVPVSLAVGLDAPSRLALRVESAPPVAVRTGGESDRAVRLPIGETTATGAYTVEPAVAGEYEFESPTVEVTDPLGLLTATFSHGETRQLTVEPRRPRRIHVGEGGSSTASMYGAHAGGERGEGIDFATLRRYVTGDPAHHIDWKATARLGEAYVNEYETESDRRTVAVFDRRGTLADGLDGERKIDYLRAVAITIVKTAESHGDPVGLYSVGPGGVTTQYRPSTRPKHYAEFRRLLRTVEPVGASESRDERALATVTQRSADELRGDESPYGTTLRPYFASADRSAPGADGRPLLGTAESVRAELGELDWNAVFTDDARREEVLQTANRLRQGEARVTVFLAPTVVFEEGGLADLESAYARYREFESFRRRLAGLDRVRAFEVAPGDRIETILAERSTRREVAP